MIGRPLAWQPVRVAGFAFESVFLPHRLLGDLRLVGAFDHHLEANTADAAEGAVGVDQVERVEGRVHALMARDQVAHRPVAQEDRQRRERDHQADEPERRARQSRRVGHREHRCKRGVVDRAEGEDDRDPVQPGEVAGEHQPQLGDDDDRRGHARDGLRSEQREGHDELGEMVARHLHPMQRLGQVMEEPAQRPRHRLRLVVVVQAGEIAPARDRRAA